MQILLLLLLISNLSWPKRDLFGVAIAEASDVDGDEKQDLWIGDPSRIEGSGEGHGGRVWLVSSRTGKGLLEIPAPRDAEDFGWTLATIPDMDGDGVDDLAVGAQFVATATTPEPTFNKLNHAPHGEGAVYLYSGAKGKLLRSWRGPAETLKVSWYSSGAGPALAAVGDWNKDGRCDLAIGWSYATKEEPEQGCVRVVSSADGAVLHEFWGAEAHDRFGFAVAGMGQADDAGPRSLSASAMPDYARETENAHANLGRTRPGYVRGYAPTAEMLFDVRSPENCRRFGYSLTWIPSSGKGSGRLAVGQSFYCEHGPAVHFLAPSTGKRVGGFGPPTISEWDNSWVQTSAKRPTGTVAISFGARVVPLSDLDRDGLVDVVVTAPQSFCTYPAAILSSGSGEVLHNTKLESAPAVGSVSGFQTHVGIASTPTDDQDGDGIDDFAIGGSSVRAGEACAGVVVLYSGKDASTLRWFTRDMLERGDEP